MKYAFTEEEIVEIQEARRKNRDKNVDRWLKALELKATGRTGQELAAMTGYHSGYITNQSFPQIQKSSAHVPE